MRACCKMDLIGVAEQESHHAVDVFHLREGAHDTDSMVGELQLELRYDGLEARNVVADVNESSLKFCPVFEL